MSDYSELKRLAEAATPGKRTLGHGYEQQDGAEGCYVGIAGRPNIFLCHEQNELSVADYDFFVAANPDAVLSLIAENERLDRESQNLSTQLGSCDRDRCQFKTENEELRKVLADAGAELHELKVSVGFRAHTLEVLRQIDAAMSKGDQL